jgi:pyruvate formate lyase activating enzyme
MSSLTLEEALASRTAEGELYQKLDDGRVRCFACGHRCRIPAGLKGVCKVRFNEGGVLRVPRGYVAGLAADPIEKKPFYHALPGATAFSFGMLGCDYHCGYCQNWITSQALRDPAAGARPQDIEPEEIVRLAKRSGAKVVTSTYNEPLITAEWAVEVFRLARPEGLLCSFVSNGNGTTEVLDYLSPWIDLYKVDLKGFDPKHYRDLGGQLEPVLETIRGLYERGVWVEVVTLVVPGFNDCDDELRKCAEFLAEISPDIPWHVTAFHDDYRMADNGATPVETLLRAHRIGRDAGLRFVYPGNVHGAVGDLESTHCPSCEKVVIERAGFRVMRNRLRGSACPDCSTTIPGRFEQPARI